MRKALIAVIAAAVLFAVGAFAASLTVSSENVASGEATVGSCASLAEVVSYDTASTVIATGDSADWSANGALIELTEIDGESCVGALVDIAVRSDPGGWADGSCTEVSGATVPTFDCDFGPLPVRPIVEVAVLVNGNSIDATPLPA